MRNLVAAGALALGVLLIALGFFAYPVAAFAADSGPVDLGGTFGSIAPILVDLLVIVIGAVVAWLANRLNAKWLLDIEASHREALHSAVQTAVGAAVTRFGPNLRINFGSEVANDIVRTVIGSVPDAVRYFGGLAAIEAWIVKAASAKLTELVGAPVSPTPSVSAATAPKAG